MENAEASHEVQQRQDENTAALVMNTFYEVARDGGATAEDITKHLLNKFGNVWQVTTLTTKTEEALKRNAAEGLLEQQGERFIASLVRSAGCCRKRRRRRSCRRRRRSCRRRRRSCRRRRRSCRRRRKKPCCCKK